MVIDSLEAAARGVLYKMGLLKCFCKIYRKKPVLKPLF